MSNQLSGKALLRLQIQRVYVKKINFRSDYTELNIDLGEAQPNIKIDLNSQSKKLRTGLYEAVLQVKVQATRGTIKKPYCSIEFDQAGIFVIEQTEDQQIKRILATDCPAVLFPYARELLDSLMVKGGHPPVTLAAVDFETLYQIALEKSLGNLVDSADESVTH